MTVHRSFITISEWQIEIKSDFKLSNNLKDLGKVISTTYWKRSRKKNGEFNTVLQV